MPNHAAGTVPHFYDRHSHPPPISTLDHHRRRRDRQQTPRAEFHLFWPSRPYKADLSILIAGCGTSQAARHALRWPSARVTGIDVSGPSLRCSEDLKRKYDLRNLEVHELPIERARELGLRFDLIVCTGVLHHLADPDAGLAALREVLEPDGAMHLMVYAPYGQAGMYMLQQFCRRLGIRAADDEIRDLIAALRQLPTDHPLEALLRDAPDLREEGALADALLHPQDRGYSVPQLLEFDRASGPDVPPLGQASPVQPSLWRHGADPAGVTPHRALDGGAICGRRALSRHDGPPQRRRAPTR